jgi:hypothetical protein
MTSEVEKELLNATGLKANEGGSRADFLEALIVAVNKLSDAAWHKLSDPAQAWANNASRALDNGKDIPEFNAQGKETAPFAKKAERPKVEKKAKKTKAEKKSKPKASPQKPVGAQMLIKQFVLAQPNITTDELLEKLAKKGFKPTKIAVSTIRTGMRQTLKIIKESGVDVRKLEL